MRGWLAVALVLALLLPGCAQKEDTSASSTSKAATSHAAAPATNGTAPPALNRTNHPPVATLAASTPGGGVPLAVNFTLGGSDPDGDALNWTLSFGDGSANRTGSALPAAVAHTFTAAGLHRVVLNVTDGRLSAERTLLVNASAAALPADVFTGHVVAPDGVENSEGECLFALLASVGAAPGGFAGDGFSLVNAKGGWTFAFDVDGMVAQFQDAAGYVGDKAPSGTVPDGATSVLACSHSAVDTDYTLTLSPP
jgi:PKD repeat protein